MKRNSIYRRLLLLIFLLITISSCSEKDSSTYPGDNQSPNPVINSLNDTSAIPASRLVISGSGFGTGENLFVRFSGKNNYQVDVPALESDETSLIVSVPPFINPVNGFFQSDTVNIAIVIKSSSGTIQSNAVQNFIIRGLPNPSSAPGMVTLNFLNWEIRNYINMQQQIQGTEMDVPSITDAVSENLTNLESLATNIKSIVQNNSSGFSLGSINGLNIGITQEELLQCDRFILGMFLNLSSADISSSLCSTDNLSRDMLSKLYAVPCTSEAFDQIEALQNSGYTHNSHYDCVASAAPDAVAAAYYVVAGAGTVALGIMALAGAPAIALALPAAAVIYATIMTSGMQITIGASLKNINNSAAVAAIHNGLDQAEDLCIGMLTGSVLPGASGAVKDIYDGMNLLGKAFISTAPACSISLSEYSKPFISTGGTGTISVTAGNGCSWSAVSQAAWITVITGISGTGNGTITYSVKPNTTSQQRTGSIKVEDKTFTITQAGSGNQTGSFDGDWEGTFNGIHTYTGGSTYEYVDEPLSLSIDGTVITGGSTSLGEGTIDALGNGTWTGEYSPFIFTGTFNTNGTASGTWTCTIPGNGPQSGTGSGTWTATRQ
ncbi:MAG: BACON domain-containing protein [Ignavibacteria bacterium]